MSIRAMGWAQSQVNVEMTTHEAFVLHLLADCHHDPSDKCFPSTEWLARHGRMHRATVQRCLNSLEELGLIVRRSGGGRKANDYTLFGLGPAKMPRAVEGEPDPGYPHLSHSATAKTDLDSNELSHSATAPRAPVRQHPARQCDTNSNRTGIQQDRANTAVDNSQSLPPHPSKRSAEDMDRCRAISAGIRARLAGEPREETTPTCAVCGAIEFDHICAMKARTDAVERSGFR